MQTNYLLWSARLGDGSTVVQFENGIERSLFRPALDVAEITVTGNVARTIPIDGALVYFRRHREQTGLDFNAQYAGLWHIATSQPVRKQIAEFARDYRGDDKETAVRQFADELRARPLASRILEQAAAGETRTMRELFGVDFYCIGSYKNGVARVLWFSPFGDVEEHEYNGVEYRDGVISVEDPAMIQRVSNRIASEHYERLASRVEQAKAELDGYLAAFKSLVPHDIL